jgi:hypothetical protein
MVKTITSNVRKSATLNSDRCFMCGENRIPALRAMEEHHVIGNKEGLTITICQNCHKVFEHNKEYWNNDLLAKNRGSFRKTLAYIMFVADFMKMHGEQLINWYDEVEEYNLDSEITILNCKISAHGIIQAIGILMINLSKIIQTTVNGISADKETEDSLNTCIEGLLSKFNKILDNSPDESKHFRDILGKEWS